MKKIFKIQLIFFTILLFSTSCIIHKKYNPFEVYFIDDGVLQYFIKPIKYKNKKHTFIIDFVVRDTTKYESFVTANYSLFSKESIKEIDSVIIKNQDNSFKITNNKKLFINIIKKKYQIRYSGKITYRQLKDFFYCPNSSILIYTKDKEVELFPVNKTSKYKKDVKKEVIDIIEFSKDN